MSAIKKRKDHQPEHEDGHQEDRTPAMRDVSQSDDVEGAESPARSMQEALKQSMEARRRSQLPDLDTGRVLAAASGITTLLGVFFFTGIW